MTRRIAIIAPIAARYDAISAAAASNFKLLRAQSEWQVGFLTAHNELDLPARIVPDAGALLNDPVFRAADLLIYHFGVYNPLIDTMLVGNGHARQVVAFHNITPPECVPAYDRPLIERSFRQAQNLHAADEIWADSPLNAEVLAGLGMDAARVKVMPLAVDRPLIGRLGDRAREPLQFLYVGRIVLAKGVHDLIEAIALARPHIATPIRLNIAGNEAFSNADYIRTCRARIAELGLDDCVEWHGTPSDETLCTLYQRAHVLCMPSYHEGFCVPVVEGLRAGCIAVGYAAGNVPNVMSGLGRLVPTGDVVQLAGAIADLARDLPLAMAEPTAPHLNLELGRVSVSAFDLRAKAYVRTFDPERIAALKISRVRQLLAGASWEAPPDLAPDPLPPAAAPVGVPVPSGTIVGVLGLSGRTPEAVKRWLRPNFVRAVHAGKRVPGARRMTTLASTHLPGPYQWLALRYAAYQPRATQATEAPATSAREAPAIAAALPPMLNADERDCYARIVIAAKTCERRVP